MRVAAVLAHGGTDNIVVQDRPDPAPGPGQALVEVAACALNRFDLFVLEGMPGVPVEMPRIPGSDAAGVVRAVGPGTGAGWAGRRVLIDPIIHLPGGKTGIMGEHADGNMRALTCVDEANLVALPEAVSFEDAAALPTAYATAYRMLFERGRLGAGELVLILGASGGVGVACTQLAKAAGARVIACASAPWKLEKLATLGADHLVNTAEEDFSAAAWRHSGKRGVDVVVNYTGGETWVPAIKALKPRGRVLTCGATAGFDPPTDLRYIWTREADILGSNGWGRGDVLALLDMVADGRLAPVIDRVVPLEEAGAAFAAMRDRATFGKILVRP